MAIPISHGDDDLTRALTDSGILPPMTLSYTITAGIDSITTCKCEYMLDGGKLTTAMKQIGKLVPNGVITHPSTIKDKPLANLKQSWTRSVECQNSDKILVISVVCLVAWTVFVLGVLWYCWG